jgi:hypothetical protein
MCERSEQKKELVSGKISSAVTCLQLGTDFIRSIDFCRIRVFMGDSEIRDALARRLNKNSVGTNLPNKTGAPVQSTKGLPPLSNDKSGGGNAVNTSTLSTSGIHAEGFLSKYSSGTFSRWQKRFFVLDGGRLSYYKRLPSEQTSPSKIFGIRKVRAVIDKSASDDRDFDLVFTTGKTYSIRAPTAEDAINWVTSLKAAIVQYEMSGDAYGDDGNDGTLSEDAGMTSMNGSAFSEVSPRQSMFPLSPSKESALSALLPSGHMNRKESIQPWDTSDVDMTGLDKNFEEWFYFIPEDDHGRGSTTIKISHVADACNRANSHLWSILGGIARTSDLKSPNDVLVKAKARMSASTPAACDKVSILVEEYYTRLGYYVNKALDIRSANGSTHNDRSPSTLGLGSSTQPVAASPTELPMLMDCVAKMLCMMERLLPIPQPHCVCGHCDPSGVNVLKLQRASSGGKKNFTPPSVNCSNEKWRKSLRTILQRLGGEVEVGLIEELQILLQNCEHTWSLSPRDPHGPSAQNHPLLEDVIGSSGLVMMTSFSTNFLQMAQNKCINAPQQWMAAYPQCSRLIAEHASSALVAVLNSLWRHFKRRAAVIGDSADVESERKYTETMRANRETLFINGSDQLIDMDHLIAFGNEAVLVSRFCSKTWSNGVSSKFTPDVFITCMDSLAVGYLATAADVAQSIVRIHFYPRLKYDLVKQFSGKTLLVGQTPMQYSRALVNQMTNGVDTRYALPCMYEAIVALCAQAIMRAYLPALVKAKPKTKVHKTLPEFLSKELHIYKDVFGREFPQPQIQLDEYTALFDIALRVMNESEKLNFTIHFNTLTNALSSPLHAYTIMNGILQIREHEFANDKKQIKLMLSSMKEVCSTAATTTCDDDDDGSPGVHSQIKLTPNKTTIIILGVGTIRQPWKFEE